MMKRKQPPTVSLLLILLLMTGVVMMMGAEAAAVCGDWICETPEETCATCERDCEGVLECSTVCGDGLCGSTESYATCAGDCGPTESSAHVISAILDRATASIITVHFTNQITTDSSTDCSNIFSSQTMMLLGETPICHWSESAVLSVSIGFDGSVIGGTTLSFINTLTTSKAIVTLPVGGVDGPVAEVSSSGGGSMCDSVIVTAQQSTGAGTQPLKYKWDLIQPLTTETAALQTELAALGESVSRFKTNNPPVNVMCTVRVTVTDQFNRTATATTQIIRTTTTQPNPSILIEGPTTRGEMTTAEPFMTSVWAMEAGCSFSRDKAKYNHSWQEMKAHWTITPAIVSKNNNKSSVVDVQSRILSIAEGVLEGGVVYTMAVNVSYSGSEYPMPWWSQKQMSVVVNKAPLSVSLGGDSRSIGKQQQQMKLKAQTTNPDNSTFSWTCTAITTDNSSSSPSEQEETIVNTTNIKGNPWMNITLTPSTTTKQLKEVKCCVSVTDHKQALTANRCMQAQAITATTAAIDVNVTLQTTHNPMSNNEKITILGSYTTTKINANNNVTLQWSVSPATIALNSMTLYSDPQKSTNLIIKAGVLQPHQSYTFRLTVKSTTSGATVIGWAEVIVKTEAEPFGGIVSLTPAAGGMSVSTLFVVQFTGWKDSHNKPLSYSVSYYNEKGTLVPLRWRSFDPYIELRVPMGFGETSQLTLHFIIRTLRGTQTVISQTISSPELSLAIASPTLSPLINFDTHRWISLHDADLAQSLTTTFITCMPQPVFSMVEKLWLLRDPTFYSEFIALMTTAVNQITDPDMLVRSMSGLANLLDFLPVGSASYQSGFVDYAYSIIKQIINVGLDNNRVSIVSILSVYDTMMTIINSTTVNTTTVRANADALIDGILSDLSTHVCGETGTYTSNSVNISNFRDPDEVIQLSGKGVTVQIVQGEACTSVEWRSYTNNPFSSIVQTTASNTAVTTVVSQVVAVLLTTTTASSSSSTIQITFDMPIVRTGSSLLCLWKSQTARIFSNCGKTPQFNTTNKVICECPINGYYLLGSAPSTVTNTTTEDPQTISGTDNGLSGGAVVAIVVVVCVCVVAVVALIATGAGAIVLTKKRQLREQQKCDNMSTIWTAAGSGGAMDNTISVLPAGVCMIPMSNPSLSYNPSVLMTQVALDSTTTSFSDDPSSLATMTGSGMFMLPAANTTISSSADSSSSNNAF